MSYQKAIYFLILFAAAVTFSMTSCKHEVVIPTSPVISYSTDVQPILVGNCTQSGCHISSNSHQNKAFALSTYKEIMSNNRIVPSNANGSQIYTAITSFKMPKSPYPSLNDQQVLKIYLWIMQGAQNN